MPVPARDTYEALRDGLLQDLLAVRLIIGEAREAVAADRSVLRSALDSAGDTLEGDIELIRAWMHSLREAA